MLIGFVLVIIIVGVMVYALSPKKTQGAVIGTSQASPVFAQPVSPVSPATDELTRLEKRYIDPAYSVYHNTFTQVKAKARALDETESAVVTTIKADASKVKIEVAQAV